MQVVADFATVPAPSFSVLLAPRALQHYAGAGESKLPRADHFEYAQPGRDTLVLPQAPVELAEF